MMNKRDYKLGLDLGATSIGWCVIDSDSTEIIDVGVRIFDDGRNDKNKATLCVTRREKRSQRRQNERTKMRKKSLENCLVKMNLLPKDENERKALKNLNPYMEKDPNDSDETRKKSSRMPLYALRAEALDKKLELHHLGRVFLHLDQRRGFQSNRKGDRESKSRLETANKELISQMKKYNARTYGEYLYKVRLDDPSKPIRLKKAFDENNKLKKTTGVFPFRQDYKNEFDAIWDKQKEFYPDILTDENKQRVKSIMFFQRPLKEQEVGYCTLEEGEKRIPKAHPLFQEFRILQYIINNIRISSPETGEETVLSYEQREALVMILNSKDKITIENLKKESKFKNIQFINEKGDEDSLLINTTERAIRKGSNELQNFWKKLNDEEKGEIIWTLARPGDYIESYKDAKTAEEQDREIIKYLEEKYALNETIANELTQTNFEDRYAHLSQKAIEKILRGLKKGKTYDEACEEAGYKKSNDNNNENNEKNASSPYNKLPYYGEILPEHCLGAKDDPKNDIERFGKISNVTVHIALNQLRLLANELISKYGNPSDIAIEYARDLPASQKERSEIKEQQEKNRKNNSRIKNEIEGHLKETEGPYQKIKVNSDAIYKYKIWESMPPFKNDKNKRACPYTGAPISITDLFSLEVEVDHILPLSKTFDDSIDNKVVCCANANKRKGNLTPYEFWGNTAEWNGIVERVKSLNKERRWRFEKDAMEQFNKRGTPAARLLNDTRYVTKISQDYLGPIVKNGGKENVQVVRGWLTAMVRRVWDLNEYKDKENKDKYRSEHYHHAIDAVVIASLTRGQLNKINNFIKNNNNKYKSYEELVKELVPIPNTKDIKNRVSKITISHKPSLKKIDDTHSTVGQLHKETAYGFRKFASEKGLEAFFYPKEDKKPIDFTTYVPIFEKKEDRNAYFNAYKKWFVTKGKSNVKAKSKEEKKIKEELKKEEEEAEVALREVAKKAFKWHVSGNNFCITIYEIDPEYTVRGLVANNRGKWESEVVSNYNATIRSRRNEHISYLTYKYPSSKKVIELHKNDMVMATFSRKEIRSMKDCIRKVDKDGKIKEGGQINCFYPGLRGYLKEKIAKHSKDYIDILFRLKKIDQAGKACFIPHDIAKEVVKEDMCWMVSDCNKLKKHKLRKVRVSVTGDILDA